MHIQFIVYVKIVLSSLNLKAVIFFRAYKMLKIIAFNYTVMLNAYLMAEIEGKCI